MPKVARELWRVVEPFHQVAYRSPEASAAYLALGLEMAPQQYFANRLAVLGKVGSTTASAVLFGFNPAYVATAVPAIWDIADPDRICVARQNAAVDCLRRIVPGIEHSKLTPTLASIARDLVENLDFAGSPLGAACNDLPLPSEPDASLWHSCTVLREHRGDAHWRATSAHGVDPVECHVLHAADGAMPADLLQRVSGWDDASWADATRRLESRRLVSVEHGRLTLAPDGLATKRAIEAATDAHADRAIDTVGAHRVMELREAMRPWIASIMEADVIGAWKMREALWRDE
jgi:hypothetical protein